MWIKVGTRGDYRVIYVILAFLVFLGLRSAYYSLYDLNGGPEKRIKIVRELNLVMPAQNGPPDNRILDSSVIIQNSNVVEHLGGARDFEETLFTDLTPKDTYALYRKNAEANMWKEVNNGEYLVKGTMKMWFKFVDVSEYTSEKYGVPEHLQGKTIFRIRIEIK